MWTVPLIRRNKRLARTMLYGSAVVLPLVASILVATLRKPADLDSSWDRPVEEYEALEPIRLLQEYLRLDTSAPDGNEIPGAEFMARHLASVGIEAHIERIGTRNANLWAILEGDSSRAIALHHHIDVEPIVHPEAWRHPPFDGVIEPPWMFGRGAFDMKSVAIAHLVAFLEIARSETRPDRSLMLLATGDEETGSRLGTQRFLREHPELVARLDAVITEGGVVEATERDRIKYWGTETGQKRYVLVWATHPDKVRLETLTGDLALIDKTSFRRHIAPEVEQVLARYGPTRDLGSLALAIEDRHAIIQDAERFAALPELIQLMMRNDVFPGDIEPVGDVYRLGIVLALLPGVTVEDALPELLPDHLTEGVTLEIEEPHPPAPASSTDHAVFTALDRVVGETLVAKDLGGVHGPYFVPKSATDARFFRAAGIPAFGFSPFVIMSTETMQMKGSNERIALVPFLEGVDLTVRAVREITRTRLTKSGDPN